MTSPLWLLMASAAIPSATINACAASASTNGSCPAPGDCVSALDKVEADLIDCDDNYHHIEIWRKINTGSWGKLRDNASCTLQGCTPQGGYEYCQEESIGYYQGGLTAITVYWRVEIRADSGDGLIDSCEPSGVIRKTMENCSNC